MKQLYSLAILFLIAIGLMAVPVMAQDAVMEETGVLIITLDDGSTLVYAEDGETLLLNIVPALDFAPGYIIDESGFNTTNYGLIHLQNDWSFADELVASAVLQLGETHLEVVLADPSYDLSTGIMTYIVLEVDGLELDKDEAFLLPQFNAGSLFIQLDSVFLEGLFAGRDARMAGTRFICPACGW